MENLFRSMKSSSDGCERSVTLTRRTATVIISAPLRSNAAAISSLSRYFPVPMIRRELNSRPAMMSLSFIKLFATEPQSHRGKKRGGDKEKGDKETRCFAAFPLVPLSPCLLVFLPLCVSVTLWQFKRSSPSPTGTSSGSGGNRKAVSSPRPRGCSRYYKGARL